MDSELMASINEMIDSIQDADDKEISKVLSELEDRIPRISDRISSLEKDGRLSTEIRQLKNRRAVLVQLYVAFNNISWESGR